MGRLGRGTRIVCGRGHAASWRNAGRGGARVCSNKGCFGWAFRSGWRIWTKNKWSGKTMRPVIVFHRAGASRVEIQRGELSERQRNQFACLQVVVASSV